MTRAPFGTLPDRRAVETIGLRSDGLHARILTLGAVLQDLRLDPEDRYEQCTHWTFRRL